MSPAAKRRGDAEEAGGEAFSEDVERRLDPLYRERPDDFVTARDALARELRAEGDKDSAAAVKKLRRPSAAAWVINRISADNPRRTQEFVEASEALADAQQRVLAGDAPGEELRIAAAKEREHMEGLVAEARGVAAGHGGNIANVVERVAETLRAVGSDAELRGRILRGRVEKERSAATVGIPGGLAAPPRKRDGGPNATEVARARRELKRLRRELADAEARRERKQEAVSDAETDLRRAKSELTDSKRAVRELEREIASAERRAGS